MLDELLASEGVREELILGAPVGVMAIHGGIEEGTAEAAHQIARSTGASHYAVVQPPDLAWHIPSVEYDPRKSERLSAFLEHVGLAISLHGFGRGTFDDAVLLGGRNRRVAAALAKAIARRAPLRVISDLDHIPAELRGVHPANPVNLPARGGVQLELSTGARSATNLQAVVEAVAAVLSAEMGSLCAEG